MIDGRRESLTDERGIVLPTVLMSLLVTMSMVTVAVSAGVTAQRETSRDQSEKQALQAAEAAINVATRRLNDYEPNAGECITGTGSASDKAVRTTGNAGAWCPQQSLPIDGSSSAVYRVTTSNAGSGYAAGDRFTRTISALGKVKCVDEAASECLVRRVVTTVRAKKGPEVFDTSTTVYSGNGLTVRNDGNIKETTDGTAFCPVVGDDSTQADGYCGARITVRQGDVQLGANSPICGKLTMSPTGKYRTMATYLTTHPAGCLRSPRNPATGLNDNGQPSPSPFLDPLPYLGSELNRVPLDQIPEPPPVDPGDDIFERSADCKITSVFGQVGGCGAGSDSVRHNGSEGSIGSSYWNPSTRALILAPKTTLRLRGGIYFFCYLEVASVDARLELYSDGSGNPARVYIGDPTRSDLCPGGGSGPYGNALPGPARDSRDIYGTTQTGIGWGSVYLAGQGKIVNMTGDPGKAQILMMGTKDRANDNMIVDGNTNRQEISIFAPRSRFELSASDAGVSRVVADGVLLSSNWPINWQDAANDPWEITATDYQRMAWLECPRMALASFAVAQPPLAADPASGCTRTDL